MASSEQPTPAPPEQPSGAAEQPSKETAVVEVSSQKSTKDDAKSVSKAQPASQSFFTYFQLLVYAKPKWIDYVLLLVGTLSAIASGVPFPLMGIIFGQLVDELNTATCAVEESSSSVDPKEVQASVDSKVLILTYAGIANFALIYIYTVTWSIFSRRLETRLRDRYFHMLLRQDAAFYDSRQAGELATRLNADIQAVQSGTSEKVGVVLACTAFFLTSYIVAFTQNWKLACMLLSLIPAFLILAGIGSFFTQKYSTLMADAIASASSIAQESLSHIAVVQAFSAGPRLETKFASRMLDARKWGIRKALVAGAQAGMLYFIAYSANALAFWQGSVQIAAATHDNSGVSVGKIYTVIFLLVDACIILGSIAPILPILGSAGASFYKLRQDIDSRAAIDSSSDEGEKLQVPISGHLSFQGITFAYVSRPDRPVLKNVSFECPAGKHTALVGLSGSGKSTIAGLTARLYDPTEGTVFLDGHDLRTLNVKNLRSFMSLVQQEPSLLDRSILENIALGIVNSPQSDHQKFQPIILGSDLAEIAAKLREGKDIDEVARSHGEGVAELVKLVRHAASLADAAGFIDRLEYGYGTLVGTGGKLVSGGQRQRIALARALIRDPQILILDEATASLDSASEHRIQMAVESIAKDRTLISIAHRLSTIKNADNIIVMNSGLIVEQGTHLELMALDGAYASMVRLQNIEAKKNDDTPSLTSTARGDVDEKDSILEAKPKAILEDTDKEDEKKEDSPDSGSNADEAKPADVADLDSEKSAWFVTKSVGRMARPDLFWIIIALCAALIVGATFTASGLIFGNTVNHVSPCKPESEIRWAGKLFGGMFFMLAVVEVFAYTLSWSGFGYVAEKLLYLIRVLSFRSLYEQGLEWHQSGGRTATSLLSVITTDAAAVGAFSGSIMGTMFSISINFIIAVILSHILNWKIALVCLVTMPILLGSGIMQMRSLASFERRHANAFSNAVGISVEAVNSFKTVSSLSLEDELMGCYRRALKAPRKEVALASAYTNLWLAISNSAGGLVYALAYWWGSKRITAGEATQTEFFIILICMLVSAQLWGQMFSLAPEVSRARAAASRILSLIDLSSAHDLSPKEALAVPNSTANQNEKDIEAAAESSKKATPGQKGTTITFKDVGFSYPARPHIPILKGMSFTIQSGQFCGLVGPSGAGKSTIMSLVQRMYTPSSGTVEIDGMDITGREGTEFRDDIAVVPQDCALFEGTIRFNVGLGARSNQEATEEEIHEACRLANIHDTIMALPDQYDTECGPNGSRLSGGQRQRLAIARALVRKPRLLLLDESTSALDAESERALQEGLERAARGITTIAITHRLHTVRKADVIFVVEGGQVVEKGRHEELVATSETYRQGSGHIESNNDTTDKNAKTADHGEEASRVDDVDIGSCRAINNGHYLLRKGKKRARDRALDWQTGRLPPGLVIWTEQNQRSSAVPRNSFGTHLDSHKRGNSDCQSILLPFFPLHNFTIPPLAGPGNPSSVPDPDPGTATIHGHCERGGDQKQRSIDDPPLVALDGDAEQFELADYSDIAARQADEKRTERREEKRAQKRAWLEEQDEMKFSHSIQFNAVPDWSSHYIAYSNLKKLIYQLEKSYHHTRSGDAESRPLIPSEDPEEIFSKALGIELEKICSFYVGKEGELLDEVNQLLRDISNSGAADGLAPLRPFTSNDGQRDPGRPSSSLGISEDEIEEDSASEDDERTGLTRARKGSVGRRPNMGSSAHSLGDMAASSEFGRSVRRQSTTFDEGEQSVYFSSELYSSAIVIKKRIISLYVQLCELKSFTQLNNTGFRKVLKKFDKILDKELKTSYMHTNVDTAYPFKEETRKVLEENIAKMETAYTDVVTAGDRELAKKDLRSHLREHVVWERNTVWRDLIGIERRGEAARLGQSLLGHDPNATRTRLQGDDLHEISHKGRFNLPAWLANTSMLTLFICVGIFFALLYLPIMQKPEQQNCLALLVFVSLLWATETIPLFVTSLLIPFLSVLLNVVRDEGSGKHHHRLNSKDATTAIFAAMWTPVIMLLLGGFTLAAALSKCKIDKRLATLILSKAGTQPRTVLIANMFVAAFASMLISNVAAPVLCYSIIEPMLRTLPSDSDMTKAVIIGIALASNVGGMLSPIASPQNVIAMGIMQPPPTWIQWFFIVIPVGAISLVLIWLLLLITFRPGRGISIAPIRAVKEQFTGVQWFVSFVTFATIALWCASHQLEDVFGDMGVIAIIPIVLFFGIGILTKEDFNNFPWTIIILAAGGLSLGKAVRSSGLLHTVAGIVTAKVQGMSLYGVLVVFSTLILVIATFISHTVAAVIFLPLVYDVGAAMELPHPNLLVMAGVLMCSAAMGLPTSGFPNMTAIMKEDPAGHRYLQVKHFISRGVPSSFITLAVVVSLGYGIMQLAGID